MFIEICSQSASLSGTPAIPAIPEFLAVWKFHSITRGVSKRGKMFARNTLHKSAYTESDIHQGIAKHHVRSLPHRHVTAIRTQFTRSLNSERRMHDI